MTVAYFISHIEAVTVIQADNVRPNRFNEYRYNSAKTLLIALLGSK